MILQQCDCLCLLYLQNISKIFHVKWKYFMSSGVVVFNNLDLSLNMLCGLWTFVRNVSGIYRN